MEVDQVTITDEELWALIGNEHETCVLPDLFQRRGKWAWLVPRIRCGKPAVTLIEVTCPACGPATGGCCQRHLDLIRRDKGVKPVCSCWKVGTWREVG